MAAAKGVAKGWGGTVSSDEVAVLLMGMPGLKALADNSAGTRLCV
jgi:hypothetical protein